MKARISQLHNTEVEWLKLTTWVPAAGEIIVYDPDTNYNYARIKIGDGKKILKNLPFLIDANIDAYLQKHKYYDILDGGRITKYSK